MISKEEVLADIFDPNTEDCRSSRNDIRVALVANPSLEMVEAAMELYAREYAQYKSQKEAVGFLNWVTNHELCPWSQDIDGWYRLKHEKQEVEGLSPAELFLKYKKFKER